MFSQAKITKAIKDTSLDFGHTNCFPFSVSTGTYAFKALAVDLRPVYSNLSFTYSEPSIKRTPN